MVRNLRYQSITGRLLALLLATWVVVVGVGDASSTADSEGMPVMVVVNESVPTKNLGMDELRQIALGARRFWPGGIRVELIVEAGETPGRRAFVSRVSGMSELQFQQYWIGRVFNQRATRAPRAAPDRRLALAMVSAIPGSLTLVSDGVLPPNTRVLTINGLRPDHPAYPLR